MTKGCTPHTQLLSGEYPSNNQPILIDACLKGKWGSNASANIPPDNYFPNLDHYTRNISSWRCSVGKQHHPQGVGDFSDLARIRHPGKQLLPMPKMLPESFEK